MVKHAVGQEERVCTIKVTNNVMCDIDRVFFSRRGRQESGGICCRKDDHNAMLPGMKQVTNGMKLGLFSLKQEGQESGGWGMGLDKIDNFSP